MGWHNCHLLGGQSGGGSSISHDDYTGDNLIGLVKPIYLIEIALLPGH
jgi:hypothetical protein